MLFKNAKEKHITYLNSFVHLAKFTCVIFHLFSIDLQVLCHATHCSRQNIDVFGSILDAIVQSLNCLTLLVNYPNNRMTIDIPFGRTLTKFLNGNIQLIIFIKTNNHFILPFVKCMYWNFCVWKNGNYSVTEVMMGWILILTWQFIPNHFDKRSMQYQKSISKNKIKLCFVRNVRSVDKECINKQIHQFGFCFDIVKTWGGAPINIIWLLKEPVGKRLSTSHVVR